LNQQPSGQNQQKNSLKECVFVNSALKTLADCFFGDYAHWESHQKLSNNPFPVLPTMEVINQVKDRSIPLNSKQILFVQ